MKRMKKFLCLMLAMVMALAMATTTFAEDATGSGSITVTGVTEGKTYDIYKIFDLTGQDTITDDNKTEYNVVAYTIDSNWVNFFFGENAEGASYLVEKTDEVTMDDCGVLSYNKKVYCINITEKNVAAFAQAALSYAVGVTPDASKTVEEKEDEEVTVLTFTGLDLGYYLVYPQGATDIKEGYASICSLTSTVPTATVNVKATYPTIEKTVNDASVEVGQVVTYTITGQVPDTTGYDSYTYKVTDTMTSGLTFNSTVSKLAVKFVNETKNTTTNITDITDITNMEDTTEVTGSTLKYTSSGFVLTFDMTNYQDYKGETITITYKAVVNDNAVVNLTTNKAELEYSNDPDGGIDKTPLVEVPVYSSKIVIDKYADNDKTKKLENAQFILVKKTTTGEGEEAITTEAYYNYTAGKVDWVDTETSATVKTTDENGAATFAGLEDGTYYLREIKSPDGYNLLTEDVKVEISVTTPEDGKVVGVSVSSEVANLSGTLLPTTGGMGTTVIYLAGIILVLAAVILLAAKRRMSSEN